MSLSYDWDVVFGWIGHEEGYDYSPAGALGYLLRCLYIFAVGYGYDDAISNRDQGAGLEPCAEGDNVHRRPSVCVPVEHRRGSFPREGFRSL